MNKQIGIIIEREFTQRVKKRSFLVVTLLTPIFMAVLMLAPGLMAMMSYENVKEEKVVVYDRDNLFYDLLPQNGVIKYELSTIGDQEARDAISKGQGSFKILLSLDSTLLKDGEISLYSKANIEAKLEQRVREDVLNAVKIRKIERYNLDRDILSDINKKNAIASYAVEESGESRKTDTTIPFVVGGIFAMMMYVFILTYGSQISMGVIEEKSSRVVEIIISSVKPFNLMMGKIIGIAAVGFLQFFIWIALGTFVFTTLNSLIATSVNIAHIPGASSGINGFISALSGLMTPIMVLKITVAYVLYFVGGYLLYGSMFAAAGSAVDNVQDMQQFSFPITMPILLSIMFMSHVLRAPTSTLSVVLSMIPFTSPMIMMARIPMGVSIWEIVTSLLILYASFVLVVYFAAKIYRVGILIYGKKVSWGEIIKWIKY